jgi:transposase-like protein
MPTDPLPEILDDDDACLEYLWRRNFSEDGQTARCPACGAPRRFYRVNGRPSYRCTSCSHHIHPTAGTILHNARTPLSLWFRAARLISSGDGTVTTSELSRSLGVNYKTARRMADLIRSRGNEDIGGIVLPSNESRASELAAPDTPGVMWSFAGDGTHGYGGDGMPAPVAQLAFPYDVAADGAGNVFIADCWNNVIRRVGSSGTISTVAGTGVAGYSGDGRPATRAQLNRPVGVAVCDDGAILIADTLNSVVRRVDAAGEISTIAGSGASGFSGDGGLATAAELSFPTRVLPFGDGFLISDQENGRVRLVNGDGVITTFAGTGETTVSGDDGPATAAGVVMPKGLAVDGDGSCYIAQAPPISTHGHCVRKVDPSGTITTFAGLGFAGFGGDDGPAKAALLGKPGDVVVDPNGGVLICEHYSHRIRRVDASGKITTVVGDGRRGFHGNGGPARAACLNLPVAIAFNPSGDLFIADSENHRIRKVTGPFV